MITIDEKRFKIIFSDIFRAYEEGTHLFSKPEFRAQEIAPQRIFIPTHIERGSEKHLYWLALVAMSDRRTTSRHLYQRFAQLFSRNRKLFEVGYFPKISRLKYLYGKYQIALPVVEIEMFLRRKKHLDEYFQGNPLNIYDGFHSIDEVLKNIDQIEKQSGIQIILPGAKGKILSLLAMFYHELGFLPNFRNIVPIDSWVQAISASAGALCGEGEVRFTPLERKLRPIMEKTFNPFRLVEGVHNATWIVGNKLCANCHRKPMIKDCPVYDNCNGPFMRDRVGDKDSLKGTITLPLAHIPKCEEEDPF